MNASTGNSSHRIPSNWELYIHAPLWQVIAVRLLAELLLWRRQVALLLVPSPKRT